MQPNSWIIEPQYDDPHGNITSEMLIYNTLNPKIH